MSKYTITTIDDTKNPYDGTDVPGEFRRFTPALNSEQIAISLIIIPPHSDFEQSTGHYHDEIEEIYIISTGRLTMRFDDDIKEVSAGSVVRVAPSTKRSHRNEGDEEVRMWAISKQLGHGDAHKIDDFWEASDDAVQHH